MEEFSDIYGALCLKRTDASFHITVLVSFKTKTDFESGITLLYLDVRCPERISVGRQKTGSRTELTRQMEKLETSSKMERKISQKMEELGMPVIEEKGSWI